MAYCITLRSRTDTRIITGWYAGSPCRWSTDNKRRKVFDDKHDAAAVCRECTTCARGMPKSSTSKLLRTTLPAK